WDALFDRAGGNTNPFPPASDKDFRSPEVLCNWILKNEQLFPVLHAYLNARFHKRRHAGFSIMDYVPSTVRRDGRGADAEGPRRRQEGPPATRVDLRNDRWHARRGR